MENTVFFSWGKTFFKKDWKLNTVTNNLTSLYIRCQWSKKYFAVMEIHTHYIFFMLCTKNVVSSKIEQLGLRVFRALRRLRSGVLRSVRTRWFRRYQVSPLIKLGRYSALFLGMAPAAQRAITWNAGQRGLQRKSGMSRSASAGASGSPEDTILKWACPSPEQCGWIVFCALWKKKKKKNR